MIVVWKIYPRAYLRTYFRSAFVLSLQSLKVFHTVSEYALTLLALTLFSSRLKIQYRRVSSVPSPIPGSCNSSMSSFLGAYRMYGASIVRKSGSDWLFTQFGCNTFCLAVIAGVCTALPGTSIWRGGSVRVIALAYVMSFNFWSSFCDTSFVYSLIGGIAFCTLCPAIGLFPLFEGISVCTPRLGEVLCNRSDDVIGRFVPAFPRLSSAT